MSEERASSFNLSRLFMRLNGPIAWLLRSPLHSLLDPALMLVTVTGRKTGKRYTIPVGYQRDGDRITVLVSRARTKTWWRNYREAGPVEVHTRGRTRAGVAQIVAPGSAEFLSAFQTTFDQMPWLGPQFGVRSVRGRRLTEEDGAVLAGEAAVVRIDLAPEERS
jgi:deazaflavin-dependent oxidoreductase (nitroreductase family)